MDIFVISVLIIVNGFFALAEIALVSSKKSKLEQFKNQGRSGAKTALKLLSHSDNFLSAVQVGITVIGIVTGIYGGLNIAQDLVPYIAKIDLLRPYASEIAMAAIVVIMTYASIVLGELVPKSIALSNPEKVAMTASPLIYYFSILFYPFIKILSGSTFVITKILRIKKPIEEFSETELRHMLKVASQDGVIEKEQELIHENLFYFSDKKAKHIMTHRTDVEWIDQNSSIEEIEKEILNIPHGKIVCCDGELDNFVGYITTKDFYKKIHLSRDFDIKSLVLQANIIPENMDAQDVLAPFQKKLVHLCFAVNEYGGFEGIITLHDIIENIVGQIPVDGEPFEPNFFIRDDNSILVNGDAPVEELAKFIDNFEVDFETVEYSTVAGFVFNQIDQMPKTGDKFEFLNFQFEIIDMDGNRIDKILLKKIE